MFCPFRRSKSNSNNDDNVVVDDDNRELKQRRRQRQQKRHFKILPHSICTTSRLFQLVQLVQKRRTTKDINIGKSGVQVKKENEKFTVVCSLSPQNLEFGHLRPGSYVELYMSRT